MQCLNRDSNKVKEIIHCLLSTFSQGKIPIVYVDDIVVTGNHLEAIVLLQKSLSKSLRSRICVH